MLRSAARMAAPAAVMASLAWTSSASAADDEDLFIVKTALNPKQWKDFECIEKKQLTHNTARLRFALPPHHELGMTTASCLVARADIDGVSASASPQALCASPWISLFLTQGKLS